MNKGVQVAPKVDESLKALQKEVEKLKSQTTPDMQEPINQLESKYESTLRHLQLKLKAYKTEYVKEKSIGKQQEKLIKGYE